MNMKKIALITLIAIFAVGILCGAAEASHTFKKGGYKMTVSNKQYNKMKKINDARAYSVTKKVGTKIKKVYQYKTVKTETFRSYFDKNGDYKGCRVFEHSKGYWGNLNAKWIGSNFKTVKHYNSDGSYYQDDITYDKWRITKKVKKNVYMTVSYVNGFYTEVWS